MFVRILRITIAIKIKINGVIIVIRGRGRGGHRNREAIVTAQVRGAYVLPARNISRIR